MKKLILISGTMGVGKSTVTKRITKLTTNSVYLDGDWCWMMNPFVANSENKKMVLRNIHYLLNSFLSNSMISTVFFCWVMDKQEIVNDVLKGINEKDIEVIHISLIASPAKLKDNINKDIGDGKRTELDLENSLKRLKNYDDLDSIKVDVSDKDIPAVITAIQAIIN